MKQPLGRDCISVISKSHRRKLVMLYFDNTMQKWNLPNDMMPLQMFGINPLGSLVLALVVPFVLVAFGTYVGVLMALQSFFGESSWQDVSTVEEE